MTDESPPHVEYGLIVPFVVCRSKDGPYHDESFTAGYQAGRVDYALASLRAVGGTRLEVMVLADLVPQIDLIAMHHGFRSRATLCPYGDEWSLVSLWESSRGDDA